MCWGEANQIATKETERLVEIIKDVKKEEFIKNQRILSEIMNKGYQIIVNKKYECSSMVMSLGSSGTGKSSTFNIIHGNKFKHEISVDDVTKQLSEPTKSKKFPNINLIDSVGFTPNLANFAKLILILFKRGFFPDYFLYPASTDRLTDIGTLFRLVKYDFVKIVVVPFSAKSYYSSKILLKNFNMFSKQEIKKKSIDHCFDSGLADKADKLINDINKNENGNFVGKVDVIRSMENTPSIVGSMKLQFLDKFFVGGKFIESITYEDCCQDSTSNDNLESTKHLLYGLLIDAVKTLPKFASYDSNHKLTTIDECKFLKDN